MFAEKRVGYLVLEDVSGNRACCEDRSHVKPGDVATPAHCAEYVCFGVGPTWDNFPLVAAGVGFVDAGEDFTHLLCTFIQRYRVSGVLRVRDPHPRISFKINGKLDVGNRTFTITPLKCICPCKYAFNKLSIMRDVVTENPWQWRCGERDELPFLEIGPGMGVGKGLDPFVFRFFITTYENL